MNMLGGKACILNIKAAFIHLIVILSLGGSGTSCKHNFDIFYHHIKLFRPAVWQTTAVLHIRQSNNSTYLESCLVNTSSLFTRLWQVCIIPQALLAFCSLHFSQTRQKQNSPKLSWLVLPLFQQPPTLVCSK